MFFELRYNGITHKKTSCRAYGKNFYFKRKSEQTSKTIKWTKTRRDHGID